MNEISIDGTAKKPQIDFNNLSGELILKGKSIPEDAAALYEPLVGWIKQYITNPCRTTNLRLNLDYFNSASAIWISKMIRELCKIEKDNASLIIHLYFDIEDFETIDIDDLNTLTGPYLFSNMHDIKVNIGIKTYGVDADGKCIKESTFVF